MNKNVDQVIIDYHLIAQQPLISHPSISSKKEYRWKKLEKFFGSHEGGGNGSLISSIVRK